LNQVGQNSNGKKNLRFALKKIVCMFFWSIPIPCSNFGTIQCQTRPMCRSLKLQKTRSPAVAREDALQPTVPVAVLTLCNLIGNMRLPISD